MKENREVNEKPLYKDDDKTALNRPESGPGPDRAPEEEGTAGSPPTPPGSNFFPEETKKNEKAASSAS